MTETDKRHRALIALTELVHFFGFLVHVDFILIVTRYMQLYSKLVCKLLFVGLLEPVNSGTLLLKVSNHH